MSLRAAALRTYRTCLKAQKEVFDGDVATRTAARIRTRMDFLKNKDLADETQIKKLLDQANEMASLLRRNVVQAVKVDDQTYSLRLDPNRHEMRNNEDDYLTKDGKMKKKSWEEPDPPRPARVRRKRGIAAQQEEVAVGGCCGGHAHAAQGHAH